MAKLAPTHKTRLSPRMTFPLVRITSSDHKGGRHIRRHILRQLVIAALLLGGACHGSGGNTLNHRLSHDEALVLAVELANQECKAIYSVSPFSRSSYAIELRDGRWHWGALDLFGASGYSALVSFDEMGGNREVQVYFSTDRITPRR
jgi:hypothetical protein